MKRAVKCTDLQNSDCNISVYTHVEGDPETMLFLSLNSEKTALEQKLIQMTPFTVPIKAKQMESILKYLFTKKIELPPYCDIPFLDYILRELSLKSTDDYVSSLVMSIFGEFISLLEGMNSMYRWYFTSDYSPRMFYFSMKIMLPVLGEFFHRFEDFPEVTGILRNRISLELVSWQGKCFSSDISCYQALIRMTHQIIRSSPNILSLFRTFVFALSKTSFGLKAIDSKLIYSIV